MAFWMELSRQMNAPEKQGLPPISVRDSNAAGLLGTQRNDVPEDVVPMTWGLVPPAERLPLRWKPFCTRTDWARWGGNLCQFRQLFLFWALASAEGAETARPVSWTEALLAFSHLLGDRIADWRSGLTVPQMAFKFRHMSISLLQKCWDGFSLDNADLLVKWAASVPKCKAFRGIRLPCYPSQN